MSKAHDLEGYLLYLADEKPELFVPLLGKLLPLQVRAKNEGDGPVNLNLDMSLSEMIDNFERRIVLQSGKGTGAPMMSRIRSIS
jgi:hypothetical protein